MKEYNSVIWRWRIKQWLTRKQAADMLDMNKHTYEMIETKRRPGGERIDRMMRAVTGELS